jgi:hypothetical protein
LLYPFQKNIYITKKKRNKYKGILSKREERNQRRGHWVPNKRKRQENYLYKSRRLQKLACLSGINLWAWREAS